MAQLRDSLVDGNLEVTGDVVLQTKNDIEKEIISTYLGDGIIPDDMDSEWSDCYTKYEVTEDGYFVLSDKQTTTDTSPTYSYITGQTENATSIYMRTIDTVDDSENIKYSILTIEDILIFNDSSSIRAVHPDTGETNRLIYMSKNGNTVVGYDGYNNENGNSHIYGNDVYHYIASAGRQHFRPYYRAGDVIDFTGNKAVRTVGYLTNSNQNVVFTICLPKPIIGSPAVTVVSGQGFVLRQGNSYTHGSAASTFVTPTSYSAVLNPSGIVVTAVFDVTTNSTNNDSIGIYWDGTVTLS